MEWDEINDRWARPARTKWMNGDTAAAEELYLEGLKETGGDGHLALRYAEMLEELGRTDDAREYFEQAESSLPIEKYRQEATNGLARIATTSPGVFAQLVSDAELREAVHGWHLCEVGTMLWML